MEIDDKLFHELLQILYLIKGSSKGSIGTIDNVYLPQIDRQRLDDLLERVCNAYNETS